MKFEPWEEFKEDFVPEILDIAEPPCKQCKNWLPQRIYNGLKRTYCGVRLCWVEEMQTDFSCYRENETKEAQTANDQGVVSSSLLCDKFTYVNVVGKGCEGWLNLFIGGYCITLVNDIEIADMIRHLIAEKPST